MQYIKIIVISLLLSGCVGVGITSTNLKDETTQTDESRLLKSAAYIIHSTLDQKSWSDALSGFTNSENIIFVNKEDATDKLSSFINRTRPLPIIQVYFEPVNKEPKFVDKAIFVESMLSLFTLSVIPGLIDEPYTYEASFSVSKPGVENSPQPNWEYSSRRRMFMWLPLLPIADTIWLFGADIKLDEKWKIEEKRRFILSFLKDAESILRELELNASPSFDGKK
ncbi:hypothetical protein GALL_184290 [mine drainage metagenome]|uniref:Lipoprotein n=1 Tax=mine drainage metagenome TaxID=410659 RepID=A0A1J5S5J1_9ZZZZ